MTKKLIHKNIADIYKSEVSEKVLAELREKYPSTLVMDMSDENNFKAARKIRTERNKLVDAINRRRIDTMNDVKAVGDNFADQVTEIYDTVVVPFEAEDKRRKEEAAKKAAAEKQKLDEAKRKIEELKGIILVSRNGSSADVSANIDAVTNIDFAGLHKDLIQEALQTKEAVLAELTIILQSKLELEQAEKEAAEKDAQIAELQAKLAAAEAEKADAEPETESDNETETDSKVEAHAVLLSVEFEPNCANYDDDVERLINAIKSIIGVKSVHKKKSRWSDNH